MRRRLRRRSTSRLLAGALNGPQATRTWGLRRSTQSPGRTSTSPPTLGAERSRSTCMTTISSLGFMRRPSTMRVGPTQATWAICRRVGPTQRLKCTCTSCSMSPTLACRCRLPMTGIPARSLRGYELGGSLVQHDRFRYELVTVVPLRQDGVVVDYMVYTSNEAIVENRLRRHGGRNGHDLRLRLRVQLSAGLPERGRFGE